ncbi:hypothetical protein [Siphonobacter aquaeclarae]|jgi:hypothetical protein|uniref:Cbb3-type cytochrome oxidase component FixQ n=1 Tax=Siphonobacter aquaeclarae TaxID=563176 RepID=A0A1G9QIG5_9BACT|nr:hypothetical protein [Siphonobacter aquaeclarae]MBO9637390.1 hypothetical protein [Siphonobacter aquaeclarae]SDM10105.1 hypothetical protein SAMN04488090_2624 [Siphonobacter aquaeclarae]
MFRNLITQLQGADLYMISSLLIFVLFFAAMGLYVLLADKKHLNRMSAMPLDN